MDGRVTEAPRAFGTRPRIARILSELGRRGAAAAWEDEAAVSVQIIASPPPEHL